MTFSLFHVKYVPVYTAFNVNLAWIVQDQLLANGIMAHIEIEPCTQPELHGSRESYIVCVPGDKASEAKKFTGKHTQ